ncbi:hypothetical protein L484_018226 [Morus notabilis]|uniref:Uncharacterized protein n=1 Tax=Morus notabilis TaxID=981085 RepID=W9QMY3_9ROSA|nr:hypothetical protein L484_018226 [Morus notabilis]
MGKQLQEEDLCFSQENQSAADKNKVFGVRENRRPSFGVLFSLLVSFPILILSTIFLFTSIKKKPFSDENPSGKLHCSQNIPLDNELKKQILEENEIAQESKNVKNHDYTNELEETPSESDDIVSESSESFELKWQNLTISESSFSEEEDGNLIEISLPGSESSGLEDEPNLPNFLPESIFSQKGLMELLADINEMNEEDNLIEIDISVGSIKCPGFEIEA